MFMIVDILNNYQNNETWKKTTTVYGTKFFPLVLRKWYVTVPSNNPTNKKEITISGCSLSFESIPTDLKIYRFVDLQNQI